MKPSKGSWQSANLVAIDCCLCNQCVVPALPRCRIKTQKLTGSVSFNSVKWWMIYLLPPTQFHFWHSDKNTPCLHICQVKQVATVCATLRSSLPFVDVCVRRMFVSFNMQTFSLAGPPITLAITPICQMQHTFASTCISELCVQQNQPAPFTFFSCSLHDTQTLNLHWANKATTWWDRDCFLDNF